MIAPIKKNFILCQKYLQRTFFYMKKYAAKKVNTDLACAKIVQKNLIGWSNWAEKNNLIVAKARFDLFSLKNQLVEQKFVLLCHFQHLLDN